MFVNELEQDARISSQTEYKQTYQPHADHRPPFPLRPEGQPLGDGAPFQDSTTHRMDYLEHLLDRVSLARPTGTYEPSAGDRDTMTSYNETYTPKQGDRVQPFRREREREEPGKFDSTPTYQDDYRTWNLPERPAKQQPLWLPPSETFGGSTTHQDTYKEHGGYFRDPGYKPNQSYLPSDQPFPKSSETKDSYVAHDPQPLKLWKRNDTTRDPLPKFDDITTTKESYKGAVQPKRESFRPTAETGLSSEPFKGETTFSSDYKPPTLAPRRRRQQEVYAGPNGVMDFQTTSSTNYQGRQLSEPRPSLAKRPSSLQPDKDGTVGDQTSYKSDFGEWKSAPRQEPRARPGYELPIEKFAKETTHQGDYKPHDVSPREHHRPNARPINTEGPFIDSTGYKKAFVPHPLEVRQPREKIPFTQPSVPMHTQTTHMGDYRGETGSRRELLRPDRDALRSDAPFVGETTAKDDFREWPLEDRPRRRQETYTGPQGDMDLQTTSQTHYLPFQADKMRTPVTVKKPESSHILDHGVAMETETNYGADYGPWRLAPREPAKPRDSYQPPTAKFTATSTMQSEFRAHPSPRQELRRPDTKPYKTEGPFTATTAYSEDFVRHPVEMRKPRVRESHEPQKESFATATTSITDYVEKYQPKRDSFKPVSESTPTSEVFQNSTTTKDSYQWTKVESRFRQEPPLWEKPEGEMTLTTTNRTAFVPHSMGRRGYIRPRSSRLLFHEGKVETTTNYSNSYTRYDSPEKAHPRTKNYEPNTEPFKGESTSKAAFVAYPGSQRPLPVKPEDTYKPSSGEFDSVTTYQQDFKEKKPEWMRSSPQGPPLDSVA